MKILNQALCASGIVASAVLFAGCSNTSPESQALPSGSSGATQSIVLTPLELLRLQAEGKLPGPIPRPALERMLKDVTSHPRPHLCCDAKIHSTASIGIWATNLYYGYLLGMNVRTNKTVAAVDVQSNNSCYEPVTVKVNASRNVWVACSNNYNTVTSPSLYPNTGGLYQEYSSAGTLKQSYNAGCPSSVSSCLYYYSYSYDGAANAKYVFDTLAQYDIYTSCSSCGSGVMKTYGTGFEWWPAGDPSATPTLISLGPQCDPVCNVYYMDLDRSGNIWFDYFSSQGSPSGYGLAEVTNPTTNPKMVSILPPGTLGFPGGVYVSKGGRVLNVTDQVARTTSQYHLPLLPSGKPFNVLGPTHENEYGWGAPASGGFNQGDTKQILGDSDGWLDVCGVAKNACTTIANANFVGTPETGGAGTEGAAYTPSDK